MYPGRAYLVPETDGSLRKIEWPWDEPLEGNLLNVEHAILKQGNPSGWHTQAKHENVCILLAGNAAIA
jgi:hypothetical protein